MAPDSIVCELRCKEKVKEEKYFGFSLGHLEFRRGLQFLWFLHGHEKKQRSGSQQK